MTEFEKLLKMYILVEKGITLTKEHIYSPDYAGYEEWIDENDGYSVIGIQYRKDGHICWYESKTDILFNYITKDW